MNEEIVKATVTRNNVKKHDYTVSDYKMCKSEAEVTIRALNSYIEELDRKAKE